MADAQDRKYHLDPETLQQTARLGPDGQPVIGDDGEPVMMWVARIVADRDIMTEDEFGKPQAVAEAGEKGGYIEAKTGEDGMPVMGEDGCPEAPDDPALSHEGSSWIHQGAMVFGDAKVLDNAQIVGPDTLIVGSDIYKGDVAAGGNYFSGGSCEFSGAGTYIDMTIEEGAACSFEGNTQIGGPAIIFAGAEGRFKDGPDGQPTTIFVQEGYQILLDPSEGFESNGMTMLDSGFVGGPLKGNPELVVQNSQIMLNGRADGVLVDASFEGPVTVVGQAVGPYDIEPGTVFRTDDEFDAVAVDLDPDMLPEGWTVPEGSSGARDRIEGYMSGVVARKIAQGYGENYADSYGQTRNGTVLGAASKAQMEGFAEMAASGLTTDQAAATGLYDEAFDFQKGRNLAREQDEKLAADVLEAYGPDAGGGILMAVERSGKDFQRDSGNLWRNFMQAGATGLDRRIAEAGFDPSKLPEGVQVSGDGRSVKLPGTGVALMSDGKPLAGGAGGYDRVKSLGLSRFESIGAGPEKSDGIELC